MAITNESELINGFLPSSIDVLKAAFTGEAAGQYHSTFYLAGMPGAAAAPAPGINGAALTSYAGQINVPSPVGGQTIYLARMEFTQAGNIGGAWFCDRLWHNSGIVVTTTTAQTITPVAIPSRDDNGLTDGLCVQAALEVSAATTNASAITNTTISYTNSDNVSGRTGSIASFPATAVAGTFVPFTLQAGDKGVRSVQSITLGTSYVTGTIHLVLYRKLSGIGAPAANVTYAQGPLELGLPVVFDNSVPFLVYPLVGTAAGISTAQIVYAQG